MTVELDVEGTPRLRFPAPFNVAEHFIDRHLREGRGAKAAVRAFARDISYAELAENVNRFGKALGDLGMGRGERLLMAVKDCPEFFYLFWGAIKAGVIPVPLNTMLRAKDFAFIIADSRCAGLAYSAEYAREVEAALAQSAWQPARVLRLEGGDDALTGCARSAAAHLEAVYARADDDCF